jgi:Leucine-rich repeat (LRR) protein
LKTVDLHNYRIYRIDKEFIEFSNIEELSLSGNLLSKVESKNLPSSIRILHLNGNKINSFPNLANLVKLVHLGLSYNSIISIPTEVEIPTILNPAYLTSLDLSYNNITDLLGASSSLRPLSCLKNLVLFGNPICLLSAYPSEVLKRLPNIVFFDEKYAKTIEYSDTLYSDIGMC